MFYFDCFKALIFRSEKPMGALFDPLDVQGLTSINPYSCHVFCFSSGHVDTRSCVIDNHYSSIAPPGYQTTYIKTMAVSIRKN